MRTTVTLDRDVYKAAMRLSRTTGRSLGKILSELARKGLQPSGKIQRRGKGRFPVFDVPENTPVIPASGVQGIIDEEGLL